MARWVQRHLPGKPAGVEKCSGVFDARASAAGMRQSSLHGRIHGIPRIECAGTQIYGQPYCAEAADHEMVRRQKPEQLSGN
jgi:hypothetical protein